LRLGIVFICDEIMKLIFLDIDGVLNTHDYCPKRRSSTINLDLVARLNQITEATGAGVVISSAWRYMIHGGALTMKGFEYLLQTHGAWFNVVGYTRKDEDCVFCGHMNEPGILNCAKCSEPSERGNLIECWRKENNHTDQYVVIDDLDLGIRKANHPFVQTKGDEGISNLNVEEAIRILNDNPKLAGGRSVDVTGDQP
jgi:hypothetical protein